MSDDSDPSLSGHSSRLLYINNTKTIRSVLHRMPTITRPNMGQRNNISSQSSVQFEISNDEFIDLRTCALQFELVCSDAADRICNALDIVDQLIVKYNEFECERIQDCATWANVFIAQNANSSWCKTEATALLGLNNQIVEAKEGSRTYAGTPSNIYSIPMSLISGFFHMSNILPLLGNKLQVEIITSDTVSVISKPANRVTALSAGYKLNNIHLIYDTVQCDKDYKLMIRDAMHRVTPTPVQVVYYSYDARSQNAQNSNVQDLTIRHDLHNVSSLHMVKDNVASKTYADGEHTLKRQSYPFTEFMSVRVKAGGATYFTSPEEIRGFADLYRAAELTHNYLGCVTGTGFISNSIMTQGYTKKDEVSTAGAAYGLCPISINLDKNIENDDATWNNGISCSNGKENIDITIRTRSVLPITDVFRYNLVHKRRLEMGGNYGFAVYS